MNSVTHRTRKRALAGLGSVVAALAFFGPGGGGVRPKLSSLFSSYEDDRTLSNDEEGDGSLLRRHKEKKTNPVRERVEATALSNLRDVGSPPPLPGSSPRDVPVFWVVPKAGTSTVKSIMGKCLDLSMASSSAQVEYPEDPAFLEVVEAPSGKYVNVDFAVPPGILKGKELGLAGTGLADVVANSYLHESAGLFEGEGSPKGKMFAVMRHPVERMVSDFYYMQGATWEKRTYDPAKLAKSLEEYATDRTKHVDNWMTRLLADKRYRPECAKDGCPLTDGDYEFARTVLKRKCLVMLIDKMDESVDRMLRYTGWVDRLKSRACLETFTHRTPSNKNDHDVLKSGTDVYEKLREINRYDIMLYWYAREIFEEQGKLFGDALLKGAIHSAPHLG